MLVLAAVGAVLAANEGGEVAVETVRRWLAESGDDGPVVADPGPRRGVLAGGAPFEVAEVDGQPLAQSSQQITASPSLAAMAKKVRASGRKWVTHASLPGCSQLPG